MTALVRIFIEQNLEYLDDCPEGPTISFKLIGNLILIFFNSQLKVGHNAVPFGSTELIGVAAEFA